jgi:uncharacterized membrane protein YoaK (UPF0700 family)
MLNIIFTVISFLVFGLAVETWYKRRDRDSCHLMWQLFGLVVINLIYLILHYAKYSLPKYVGVIKSVEWILLIVTLWIGYYMIRTLRKVW